MSTETLDPKDPGSEHDLNRNESEGPESGSQTEDLSSGSQVDSGEQVELSQEEKLELEIKKLKEEVENYRDSWQRERAEFTNFKRRTAQELLNSRKEAVRNFIQGLLSPFDNLDHVTNVKSELPELKAFVDGVVMVKKEILSILDREGVKKLEPVGESFDPMMMEAIASEESDSVTEEIVSEVYQSGYYFQDGEMKHSIRPARVKVSKPKSTEQLEIRRLEKEKDNG